ncbi:unknown [Haloarcula marismortui ATCC 43049]|uniref:Winged helix-turn-helix domain-containing protein n=2 Tax=Haloarcula marismortui (strain ATCC 43049 / DSM 3752 / JCM 8966 / VKM B-1809) TaxID=272569 RepID=Q5V538_HALMA|nr:winged helix-turn-helix domain-containing protein [Haloarcula marismortui]AAV45364.1 unknown [Haloarcula marismortui ATCC 43049]
MSKSTKGQTAPKSMRHKQILDVAAENPEASIAELAAEVPSATAELVERVLEEHGDPAETDETDSSDESPAEPSAGSQSHPAPEDLSSTERETLRAIQQHPTASQRDLAETLGVTASTVSNRVNGIDGFDWTNREAFANAVFCEQETGSATPSGKTETPASDSESSESTDTPDDADGRVSEPDTASDSTESSIAAAETAAGEVNTTLTTFQSTVEDLSEQLAELEGQVETIADGGGSPQSDPFQDPELVHKVVHACMDSEKISEDEELRILDSLL